MSQSEDMDAIDQYMRTTSANTQTAASIRSRYIGWYDSLSWFDKNFNDGVYSDARARRNAFNLANVKTPEEKQQVQAVIDQGMTTEQMSADPSTGSKKVTDSQPSKVVSHPTIRKGSKGDDVKEWQRVLGIKDDGDFGSGTKKATEDFQRAHGLKPDGVVGPKTWMAAYVSNTAQNGQSLPGAVVDPKKEFPAAIAPHPSDITQKAASATYPAVYQKPIGQPVPASKVKAAMAGMLNPQGWSTEGKLLGGFFAMVAVFLGLKSAREAGDHKYRRVA